MKEDRTWDENELRDLILFAQSLREENEELRSKIIVMDAMVKKREAELRRANQYIRKLEETIAESGFGYINLN
jgi:peptidoglycan hydrolase CwlO-like protein